MVPSMTTSISARVARAWRDDGQQLLAHHVGDDGVERTARPHGRREAERRDVLPGQCLEIAPEGLAALGLQLEDRGADVADGVVDVLHAGPQPLLHVVATRP